MGDLKAIETRYKGYRFRSRLEARWAVFFDALGVPWEYEKEGYRLPSGLYLPDFWLPKQACWIEVKGDEPSDLELQLASELGEKTESRAFVFHGSLFLPDDSFSPPAPSAYFDGDYPYCWCECLQCRSVGISFDGRSDRLPCKECYFCAMRRKGDTENPCPKHGEGDDTNGCRRVSPNLDKGYSAASPRIASAFGAAIAARFEHGESPCPK